jgi:hypothetical protein
MFQRRFNITQETDAVFSRIDLMAQGVIRNGNLGIMAFDQCQFSCEVAHESPSVAARRKDRGKQA